MRDLVLALADHAQRRALHAAGGQAAPHLLPQQRREIEADEVVERAARLLRVHEVERQVARLGDGALHFALGDLVEHHAFDFLALEVAALFEQLAQVPGDGFAFAVRVGREIEVLGFLQRARDGVDVFFVALDGAGSSSRTACRDRPRLPSERGRARGHSEASTSKSLPRYFLMVFALAGDSTMTRFSAISWATNPFRRTRRSSMRAQACSCPGWLDSTMSTSHLSRSMSTSSLSSATRRSMTISRCSGERMPSLLELQQVAAAAGRDALELVGREHAQRALVVRCRGANVRRRDRPASRARARRCGGRIRRVRGRRPGFRVRALPALRPACTGRTRK